MKTIDLSVEKDPKEEKLKPKPRYPWDREDELCYFSAYELRLVLIDDVHDDTVVIETVFTNYSFTPGRYLHHLSSESRRHRSPELISLSFYTGEPRPHWRDRSPPRFKHPIRALSLCFGGSHCLVYELSYDPNNKYLLDDIRRDIEPFRFLLEDRRNKIVGMGMKRFVKEASEQWNVHVANPVDLRTLAGAAFGMEKVFWWAKKKKKGIEMEGMELEEMAEMALYDGKRKLRKKPNGIKRAMDCSLDEVTEEMLGYATRDAYLAFEIGKKCYKVIGREI